MRRAYCWQNVLRVAVRNPWRALASAVYYQMEKQKRRRRVTGDAASFIVAFAPQTSDEGRGTRLRAPGHHRCAPPRF